jgi:hypothetical protein
MKLKKKWYKRYKLLSFDDGMLVPIAGGEYYNGYTLTIQVEYLWGLFKKIIEVSFEVNMFSSPLTYESHWQELIETEQYL